MGIDPVSLAAEISAAFDGVAREDGTTLHEGEGLDCRYSPEELAEARKLDTDSRWQDVPDDWVAQNFSGLNFLNPKGLRYYLPVVMLWHFRHSDWSEPAAADTLNSLIVHGDTELFDILTDAQRRATARWLFFFNSDGYEPELRQEGIRKSMWGKYL